MFAKQTIAYLAQGLGRARIAIDDDTNILQERVMVAIGQRHPQQLAQQILRELARKIDGNDDAGDRHYLGLVDPTIHKRPPIVLLFPRMARWGRPVKSLPFEGLTAQIAHAMVPQACYS